MKKQDYIIYVSGLGDHWDSDRRFALRFWQVYGVKTELMTMNWNDGKDFNSKFATLSQKIKKAQQAGYRVSLVGESAAGSMVINAFAADPWLHRVITICGVNNTPSDVHPELFRLSPAFKQSMNQLKASLQIIGQKDCVRIISIHSLHDSVVPVKNTHVEGSTEIVVPSVGHVMTITLMLTIMSFLVILPIRKSSDEILL